MWPFRRRMRPTLVPDPMPVPESLAGPQVIRRTVITIERELISTVVRRPGHERVVEPDEPRPLDGGKK